MEIIRSDNTGVTVLTLQGRLDLASGNVLKEQARELFDDQKLTLHINMQDVEFINSSGLGALVSIMKEVRLRKGRLTLSNLASYVQEIFDITQLSHIFEIFGSEDEAVASYQPTAVNQ